MKAPENKKMTFDQFWNTAISICPYEEMPSNFKKELEVFVGEYLFSQKKIGWWKSTLTFFKDARYFLLSILGIVVLVSLEKLGYLNLSSRVNLIILTIALLSSLITLLIALVNTIGGKIHHSPELEDENEQLKYRSFIERLQNEIDSIKYTSQQG